MSFLCPHLIDQYFQKVAEILISYKPQIVFLVNYKDISEGLIQRSVLRKEEHEDIIKIKNREKRVEKLLTIIPKRMWGLENFMTVLIDENVNTWLAEELFKAYIRHLVDSIKKQQAERKCECLKSGNSLLRRKWIQLLQIFDAWVYNVGTSLGFVTTTIYPVDSSLEFISKRLPLPRKRQAQLQWQTNSLFNNNSQSVIVTEVEDDDEQMAISDSSRKNSLIMNYMPTTAVISRPIKALTNGLIITPLRAINGSLTRSVDRLSSLTNPNEPKPLMITYPEQTVSTGNLSEMSALSTKSTPLSRVTQKYFNGSNLNSSFENISFDNGSTTSLTSSSEKITPRPKINSFSSSDKKSTKHSIPPSSPASATRIVRKSPITPKVSLVVNPMKSSVSSSTKSVSPVLKTPISSTKSSIQTKSNPSVLKTALVPSASDSSKNSPKSNVEISNRLSVAFDLPIDHTGITDVVPEEPECDFPKTRTVGTNTIFHYSTIQQPLKRSSSSTTQIKSNTQAKLNNNITNAATILTSSPIAYLDDVETTKSLASLSSLTLSPTLATNDSQSTLTSNATTRDSMTLSQDSINSVFSEASTSSVRSLFPNQSLTNIPSEVAAEEVIFTPSSHTEVCTTVISNSAPTTPNPNPVTTTSISNPVTTTESSNPVTTTESSNPVTTTESSNPVTTTESSNPVATTPNSNPVTTTENSKPVTTTENFNPVTTTENSNPVNTTENSNPVTTTESSNPVATTPNSNPVTTTENSKPVATTENSKPVITTLNGKPVTKNNTDMSKSLSNLSKTKSLSTSSSKVSQDPKQLKSMSMKTPNGIKSSSVSSSLPATPISAKKGKLHKTISSVVERLSKPKTVKTVSEPSQEKSIKTLGLRISPGTKSLNNSPLLQRRKLSSSSKSPEVKAESLPNSKTSLNISNNVTKLKKVAKVSPSKPKFNASTKYKPPPPPPSIIYEPFSPEDYNFQMWSNEWVSKKLNKNSSTGIH